jgi:hypothetical protein
MKTKLPGFIFALFFLLACQLTMSLVAGSPEPSA